MIAFRKAVAVICLATFSLLIVTSSGTGPLGSAAHFSIPILLLLLPLAVAAVGIVMGVHWCRWFGLAAALAVLPWACAFVFTTGYAIPVIRPRLALAASVLLFLSLTGPGMFQHFEGRSVAVDWSGPRMILVRWTAICNMASVLVLYFFVVAYNYRVEWHHLVMLLLLLALLLGVLLVCFQKTAGLLIVALSCLLFVPAGTYFVLHEAAFLGEALLFALVFLPGVGTAVASMIVFGKPVLSFGSEGGG
jgi:hypothetical protein